VPSAALQVREGGRVTPATRKLCTGRCGRRLPIDAGHFHRHAPSRDGFRSRCRDCIAADRRDARQDAADAALAARLAAEGVLTVATAYRKGRQDGAAAALRVLRSEGRLLPSDDAAAAQARAQRVGRLADAALERLGSA
jgi:hypothetical protein